MNEPRVKPLLRGVSHEVAAAFAVAGSIGLVLSAPPGRAAIAAGVYGTTLALLFGISALYHRPMWPPGPLVWLRRIDHSMIFLFIAGTYTPLSLLLPGRLGTGLLVLAWIYAALGTLRAMLWPRAPRMLATGLYLLFGWLLLPFLGPMARTAGTQAVVLLAAGGLLYTLGGIVYATRKPNPVPRVFGYHEVFHLMVIAASALHFAVMVRVLRAVG